MIKKPVPMSTGQTKPKTADTKPIKPTPTTIPEKKSTTPATSSIKFNPKPNEPKPQLSTATKGNLLKAGNKAQPVEEEKKESPKTGLFTTKPSARLTSIKTADPFASKQKLKTNSFAYVYNAGGIPCRIDHGSINNRLKWNNDINIEDLTFDPILITCFEGLIEEQHPFNFIAKEAIKELLESQGSADKALPLLARIAAPLRNALGSATLQFLKTH